MVVGIDASRLRSGGGRIHIVKFLSRVCPLDCGVSEVHVWGEAALLAEVPDAPWLIKHATPELEESLLGQVWWQAFKLSDAANLAGCDVLFSPNAATFCKFRPSVVMSQNMLPFEPTGLRRFGGFLRRCFLSLNRIVQSRALRRSAGVIFLTRYSGDKVQSQIGRLPNTTYIPHGISERFKRVRANGPWPIRGERPIKCIYVTQMMGYKNIPAVFEAIFCLRQRGVDVELELVGGPGDADADVLMARRQYDSAGKYLRLIGAVSNQHLPERLALADIFVFASSCEALPITLLEGMASGLPIACSNRGPMPEIAQGSAVLFDPEKPGEIADAIHALILDEGLRDRLARRGKSIAMEYDWNVTARQTLTFIAKVAQATDPAPIP